MRTLTVRSTLVIACLYVTSFLSACDSSAPQTTIAANSIISSPTAFSQAAATQAVQPTPTAEILAARVNGQGISMAALDREVARRLETIRSFGNPLPRDLNQFRNEVLDTMIEQVLIEQAAAIQGIQVSEAELDAEIAIIIEIAGSRENWEAQLKADRLSEAEYRANLRAALITQRMRDIVTATACKNVEQVRARHILVPDEQKALALRAELENGADFAMLAALHSLDVTTRQIGGDLGWFARGQLLQEEIEVAAFSLPINALSAPIKTELGYHILQVLERSKERPVDEEMCYRLTESTFERWIRELISRAKIEKFL
ncbi:MAG: peptidylprolyl isomerase [Anaerolineae bacterium]|nr:peptidylprolyl isomerase [Anaerolineae bacterium]MDW8298173.1 peptidylprolyl isomerase [Anaerolineae bacterium]